MEPEREAWIPYRRGSGEKNLKLETSSQPEDGSEPGVLATPISSVRPSISKVTFDHDIEDFDVVLVCSLDIDVLRLRYRHGI